MRAHDRQQLGERSGGSLTLHGRRRNPQRRFQVCCGQRDEFDRQRLHADEQGRQNHDHQWHDAGPVAGGQLPRHKGYPDGQARRLAGNPLIRKRVPRDGRFRGGPAGLAPQPPAFIFFPESCHFPVMD